MCYIEYFPIIPKGCIAANKHVHMVKDITPCFETVAIAMARQADSETDPKGELAITLCLDAECMRIDCFRRKMHVAPLQESNPHCPICTGEKTLVAALLVDTDTEYAVLPTGRQLRTAATERSLPSYFRRTDLWYGPDFDMDRIRLVTTADNKLRYDPARDGVTNRAYEARVAKRIRRVYFKLCKQLDEESDSVVPATLDLRMSVFQH
ncbi:uncharacterized protein N7482_003129 [Penicillium canariense]|uniref:Uncharacterized protein n=1 Tax=Penicillium canariense TaxID=189055 RepID=A0A9W9IJ21_9EURO|nr:uncharacterized protein N7482_003129 [Penicillium canariense]KAJ5177252.1 hypothetical protein N7482_003129 [Penicillium canariense]